RIPLSITTCVIASLTFSIHFFYTAPAPTEIYTLSLHDALPIYPRLWEEYARDDTSARTFTQGLGSRRHPERRWDCLTSPHPPVGHRRASAVLLARFRSFDVLEVFRSAPSAYR